MADTTRKRRVPNVRFKGFTDDWEQRKLGEISSRVRGNDGRMNLPLLTISAKNGWMTQKSRFSSNIAGKEKKNYTLLLEKELSYNHGNSKAAIYGTVFELQGYTKALVPKVYHSFKVQNDNPKFIESYFHTKKLDRQLRQFISSTARMDGLLNISFEDFMKVKLLLPTIKEQDKISILISKINNLLSLYQRKLNLLKQLKKALLQKMFADKDSNQPTLRFEGFIGDWEQRKLGDITSSYSGGTPSAHNRNYYDGLIPFIRSAEINNTQTELTITNQGLKNSSAKLVKAGDILYALYGATSGEVGISKIDGAINQAIMAIIPQKEVNSYFLISVLRKKKNQIIHKYLQGGQGNLSASIVKSLLLYRPRIEEQNIIARLMVKVDDLLALYQSKINILTHLKKFLLQQMFI